MKAHFYNYGTGNTTVILKPPTGYLILGLFNAAAIMTTKIHVYLLTGIASKPQNHSTLVSPTDLKKTDMSHAITN